MKGLTFDQKRVPGSEKATEKTRGTNSTVFPLGEDLGDGK